MQQCFIVVILSILSLHMCAMDEVADSGQYLVTFKGNTKKGTFPIKAYYGNAIDYGKKLKKGGNVIDLFLLNPENEERCYSVFGQSALLHTKQVMIYHQNDRIYKITITPFTEPNKGCGKKIFLVQHDTMSEGSTS